MAKQDEDFGKLKSEWKNLLGASETANKSMGSYVQGVTDAIKLSKQLAYAERKLNKLIAKREELAKDTTKEGIERLNLIDDEIDILEKQNALYKKQIDIQKKSLSLTKAMGNSIKNGVWKFTKQLPGYYTEQDKAVRQASLSMGTMNKESSAMFNTMSKTGVVTAKMGLYVKDLAKLQQGYSEQVGKTMKLSSEGLMAMAELQQGAFMGDSGIAAEYASNLENFGYSAERARDLMEEGINLAVGIGVNTSKYSKDMVKNLKLAQGYNFKGGLNNMKKMTAQSIRFKLSMESIAGIADKLITPEGAVEMAANLQVLGGAWAKLADPFTLMYQARHDMDGLQKSVIEATAGTAQFNKETKEFEISGMEMHRLREVAKNLGMDYKELAESSKAFAKTSKIKSMLDVGMSPEAKEFVSSNANYNKNSGKWEITFDENGKQVTKSVKDLGANFDKVLKQNKASLDDRARASQTFDNELKNLVVSLKTTFLPFIKGLETGLKPILDKFIDGMSDKDGVFVGIAEKMETWGKNVGEWITKLTDFFSDDSENGIGTMGKIITTALVGGLAVTGIAKAAMWILNGRMLGVGFNMVAGGGTGSGTGGMFGNNMSTGSNYNKLDKKFARQQIFAKGNSLKDRVGYAKIGLGSNKLKPGTMGNMGLGMLGMGGSMAMDYGRNQMDDPYGSGGKALGIGSSALQGASMGLMVGGPWGALAGGLIGGGTGAYQELTSERPGALTGSRNNYGHRPKQFNDFISRPGEPISSISPNDTLIGAKKGGPVDKMLGNSSDKSGNNGMTVEFKPLKIEFGAITINGTDSKIDFANDPHILRELSGLIQTELRKAIGGGKLTPNQI